MSISRRSFEGWMNTSPCCPRSLSIRRCWQLCGLSGNHGTTWCSMRIDSLPLMWSPRSPITCDSGWCVSPIELTSAASAVRAWCDSLGWPLDCLDFVSFPFLPRLFSLPRWYASSRASRQLILHAWRCYHVSSSGFNKNCLGRLLPPLVTLLRKCFKADTVDNLFWATW